MLGELSLSNDPPNAVQEIREHPQFQRRELDLTALKRHTSCGRIDANSPMLQDGTSNTRSAPYERAQPCRNLGNMERLGYVVIGAGIEAIDFLRPGPARRKDEHRNIAPLGTPSLENVEPLHLRQPEIKDHGGIRLGCAKLIALKAVGSPVDDVTGLSKSGGQTFGELIVILDQQNANFALLSIAVAALRLKATCE